MVANDSGEFSHPILRETAALSLTRLMSISSILCDQYLPLLFTVFTREQLPESVRTSLMIAIGDLAFRFPNSLEPWTNQMYLRYAYALPMTET